MNTLSNCEVRNTRFINNSTIRGALYPLRNTNILVEGCLFDGNIANNDNFGGAMFIWNSTGTVRDTKFEKYNTIEIIDFNGKVVEIIETSKSDFEISGSKLISNQRYFVKLTRANGSIETKSIIAK